MNIKNYQNHKYSQQLSWYYQASPQFQLLQLFICPSCSSSSYSSFYSYCLPLFQYPTQTMSFLSLQIPNPSFLLFTNQPQQTQLLGHHQSPNPCLLPSSRYSVCHPPRYLFPSKCQMRQIFLEIIIVQFVYLLITKFQQGILSSEKMVLAVQYRSDFYWFLYMSSSVKSLGILTVSLYYPC